MEQTAMEKSKGNIINLFTGCLYHFTIYFSILNKDVQNGNLTKDINWGFSETEIEPNFSIE